VLTGTLTGNVGNTCSIYHHKFEAGFTS